MPDVPEEFEVVDRQGTTEHYNGTVGTTAAQVPSVAGNVIAEVLVRNKLSNPSSRQLLVSFDGGTTFYTLNRSEHLIWGIKGGLTQIDIKASSDTIDYEIIMNREIV